MTLEAIDHVEFAIPPGGEGKARAFYAGLLGLAEQPKPTEMAGRGGCWFERGPLKVHLGVEADFRPARKAHIAFRVADVTALTARARAAGFEVVDDSALPGHRRAFIFDPFGNRLEFLAPTPERGLPARPSQDAGWKPALRDI
ncbi:MAG: VOC family protein [Caulobacteraceae bacterium]